MLRLDEATASWHWSLMREDDLEHLLPIMGVERVTARRESARRGAMVKRRNGRTRSMGQDGLQNERCKVSLVALVGTQHQYGQGQHHLRKTWLRVSTYRCPGGLVEAHATRA